MHLPDFRLPLFSMLNTRLVKYSIRNFEESNSANHQKQSYYYATETWRDIKIALMNKLARVKSHLQAQLSAELCKLMTDHKSYIEVRDSTELLVSMIEMTYGLQ